MLKKLFKFLFIDEALRDDIKFLKQVSLFGGLSDRALAKIALIVFAKTYSAGEELYKPGQDAEVVYLIKEGQVKIKSSKDEMLIEKNDFFSEIALIENKKHNVSATVMRESELYLIYRAKFDEISQSYPAVGLKILRNLANILEMRLKCHGV